MKRNLLLLLFMLGVFCVHAQWGQNETPFLTQSFSPAAVKVIKAETSGGFIKVEGGRSSGLVEVYVTPSNGGMRKKMSEQQIKEILNRYYDLEVRTSGNTLLVRATRKDHSWSEKTALSVSFKIHSGKNVDTELKTSGGSITLSELKGDQLFKTSGGSLTIHAVDGKITGKTSGGSIDVTDATDEIDLVTSGGSIKADNLKGRIRLKTSGGSLSLSDLSGTIEARTSGGSITASDIRGDLLTSTSGGSVTLSGIDGNLEASTSGGRIRAQLVGTKDFVKLRTSAGGVNVNMPRTSDAQLNLRGNKVNISRLGNFNGSIEKDHVRGTIGSGKLLVEVAASSGNVDVNM
ncbi:DUF4097 family beta strand repeat-containing protein [Niabella beijingensis]|uniref:DUF4097 family beta strand repeat-containing protein n=1 Tax=Niabella beijingensis TaxID=2872700 RepID=UPI001CC12520|nr:DUF4097 domain-containing protein [Niabella beijingensis]MBZ4191467.1 DUF4097 domain-containing protein [Niabella beijingensis]